MVYPYLYDTAQPSPAVGDKPSRSASYRTKLYSDDVDAPASTLFELFRASVKANADLPALGYRPIDGEGTPGKYKFFTYQETAVKVHAVASALHHAGVQKGQRVGVYGQNSCEWMIILQVLDTNVSHRRHMYRAQDRCRQFAAKWAEAWC